MMTLKRRAKEFFLIYRGKKTSVRAPAEVFYSGLDPNSGVWSVQRALVAGRVPVRAPQEVGES